MTTTTSTTDSNPAAVRTALVTGSSRGIGRAIARRLAADGAFVAVHYAKAADAAREVVDAIVAEGGQAVAIGADLAQPGGTAQLAGRLIETLTERFGSASLDILVNNAGVGGMATIDSVDEAAFDRTLQLNLKSPFFLIQKLLPHLRDGGRIVNISSMGTRAAYPSMAIYAPSKAGLEALSVLLAAQLGPRGITVNAVLPGATATDMNDRATDPVQAAALAQTIALRRVGQPEDIADIVAFLASPQGRWVTGQRIDASGGQRL